MRQLGVLCLTLIASWTLAQGALSGTLYAPEIRGYLVIACFPGGDGCDEARSSLVEITASGSSAPFNIPNLAAGQYLLIAWKDLNNNGEAEDNELTALLLPSGEPLLISPPSSNLELRVAAAQPAAASTIPAELVGTWQQTRASASDYRNTYTGATFSATSGFSVQLKIRPDSSYYLAHYSSGVSNTCPFVSYFEQSVGSAQVQGGQLILHPTERQLEVSDCSNSGTQQLANDPIVYAMALREEFDYNGLRGYALELTGGPYPLELDILHREPLMPGYQSAQPADFVLGSDPPYQELIGLWTPHPGSDTNFYNPQTGDFYLPEYDGTAPEYVRFSPDSYELARAWRQYNVEGVCKKDYLYYERGTPTFVITENLGGQSTHVVGHARFQASEAHLIVNIRDCDEDDEVRRYSLVPQISYYRWIYRAESNWLTHIPEGFSLECAWERSEWQFMLCDGYYPGRSLGRKE